MVLHACVQCCNGGGDVCFTECFDNSRGDCTIACNAATVLLDWLQCCSGIAGLAAMVLCELLHSCIRHGGIAAAGEGSLNPPLNTLILQQGVQALLNLVVEDSHGVSRNPIELLGIGMLDARLDLLDGLLLCLDPLPHDADLRDEVGGDQFGDLRVAIHRLRASYNAWVPSTEVMFAMVFLMKFSCMEMPLTMFIASEVAPLVMYSTLVRRVKTFSSLEIFLVPFLGMPPRSLPIVWTVSFALMPLSLKVSWLFISLPSKMMRRSEVWVKIPRLAIIMSRIFSFTLSIVSPPLTNKSIVLPSGILALIWYSSRLGSLTEGLVMVMVSPCLMS